MRKKYEIPIGTKVEIISEDSRYNGRIGTLGAKDPSGMPAHNIWFDNDEFDCFMDDEFLPMQNIITIDKLDYETLGKVFEHDYIYETDRIIIKKKCFSFDEIEKAYVKHCNDLAAWANGTYIISEEDDFDTEHRDKVIGLLGSMIDDCETGGLNAIRETIMWEQWWIEGFRKHLTWNGKDKKPSRYFNPEAKIETIFI